MTRLPCIAAAAALVGCAPAVYRPMDVTDAATALEQITHSSMNEFDPAVSPDGQRLAYEVAPSRDAPPRIAVASLDAAGGRAGAIQYDSGSVVGVQPAWRPDGSALYFFSNGGGRDLVELVGLGPGVAPLVYHATDVEFAGEWPTVSPDGAKIAMSVANANEFHTGWRALRHFDHALGFSDLLQGGFHVAGEGTEPAFSPDGKRLAFVRVADGHAHLFVANADGTNPQQITDGPGDDLEPAWSPAGDRIVFCSGNAAAELEQAELFTVHPDGAGLVQLTQAGRYACHPSWARDGFVYFHYDARARFHVWRLRPT